MKYWVFKEKILNLPLEIETYPQKRYVSPIKNSNSTLKSTNNSPLKKSLNFLFSLLRSLFIY